MSIAGTGIYRTPDLADNWFNASSHAALTAAFTGGDNNNAEITVSPQSGRIPWRSGQSETTGRGQWGPALQVTLDTIAPPVSILRIDPAGLDSGVAGDPWTFVDGVTNGTATGFVGRAEANAIVRLYVDAVSNDPGKGRLSGALADSV